MALNKDCISLKEGKMFLGEQAMSILKKKTHLCGNCTLPYSMCPKLMNKWQPIEFYGWITEGAQTFTIEEVPYRLSPEEQMDLYDTGKYKIDDVPTTEKVKIMVPDTFLVTKCEKFKTHI